MDASKIIKNASWIIACRIVQSALGLIVALLTARYLGPSNYGLISYAASLATFVEPIMQLGLNAVLVQEIVNCESNDGEIIGTSLVLCLGSSVVCVIGVITFVAVANAGEKTTIAVCGLYSLILIFKAIEIIQYWFQAKLLSKYTSIISLVAYLTVSVYKIYLLATAKNIYWFAVSNVFDYLIIGIGLLLLYVRISLSNLCFSKMTAIRMLKKSKYYIVSSMMITVFAQTDRIMLKLIINELATGYYSVAVTCAGLTSFIFSAIIDSARPTILESKKENRHNFEINLSRLYSLIIYMALAQSLVVSIFAGVIINILYGATYCASIPVLRLVVWYTTFSYIGAVRNIWILAENKQKYLWIINLSGALLNIMLNAFFIPKWGSMGAAFASLVTQFFTNYIMGYIIKPINYNNKIIVRSLNPKYCLDIAKKFIIKI